MSDKTADFIARHRTERVAALALALSGRSDVDAPFALRQIEGWQRLRTKVPSWAAVEGLHYPPRLSLEQCSGEAAARYKAGLAARLAPGGGTFIDLTGGLGVDFSFLARRFARSVYVERNAELCRLARHNFPLLGLPGAEVVQAEAADYLRAVPAADLIFLDPARRDGAGRKTVLIEDCEPDAAALLPRLLALAPVVLLKLSPMLDWHRAAQSLGGVSEVHVVADGGECKELLLVCCRTAGCVAVHVAEEGCRLAFRPEEEAAASPAYADGVGDYLFEPGPAALKAGCFKLLAVRYGLRKLHPNSHLYTGPAPVAGFPGRVFRVTQVADFSKSALRALRQAVPRANLAVRNFPATVAELRRRLRIAEGGDDYLFATTLASGRHVLVSGRKTTPLPKPQT